MINSVIRVIRKPDGKTSGIQLAQHAKIEEKEEFIDISSFYIEEYNNTGEVICSIKIKTEEIELLIGNIRAFNRDGRRSPRLVRVKLIE